MDMFYSGGVQLTINGSNLILVERPQMNVSVLIRDGKELNHTYTIMVSTGHIESQSSFSSDRHQLSYDGCLEQGRIKILWCPEHLTV